jgi:predicted nuclease of restriction endonuclease-like (RecB) superfamily
MKKKSDNTLLITPEYRQFIEELKLRIISAQISAARRINHELILLYWDIGHGIVEKQKTLGWGDSVVKVVAADLQKAFPGVKGFSPQNLWRMLQFYLIHTEEKFLSQVVRDLENSGNNAPDREKLSQFVREMVAAVPWGHHANALTRVTDPAARLWYLRATARFGWSRNVLLNQIKASAYERAITEKKTHNFDLALPEHFAEQADEMLKSSYNLEFLGLRQAVRERELEDRLVSRLQSFLLELGPFQPEFAGKMDFYLNLLNDKERGPDDQPSIGIILCAEKDDVEVEYALRTKANPIGVAVYQLQSKLPGELKGKLPTAKQLAGILRAEMRDGKS